MFFLLPYTLAEETDPGGDTVEVESQAPSQAAMEKHLDAAAVRNTPARSADELLRAMPGLQLSAHGGYGKAFQYLLRGFDAVHGADLAVSLEGVPLNEVSNIHGQGYLDLYFLPPELVQGLDLVLGSGRPEVGDFAVAGSANYHLGLSEEGTTLRLGGGTDRSGRVALGWHPADRPEGNFLWADLAGGLGVGEGRGYQQAHLGGGGEWGPVRLWILGYDGAFDSPGVLREEDLEEIGFYGAYPEAGGGRSRRLLGAVGWEHSGLRDRLQVGAWGQIRALELRHNFTGYLQNAEQGDGRLQEHQSAAAGLTVGGRHLWTWRGLPSTLSLGSSLRFDSFVQSEDQVDTDGERWAAELAARGNELDLGLYALGDLQVLPWLRLDPGFRLEYLRLHLDSRVEEGEPVDTAATSFAWVPQPKVAIGLRPLPSLEIFSDYGRSFRSPEARGIADGDVAPVVHADTVQVGLNLKHRWLSLRAATFRTTLSSEIVFDHLAGRFLSSGRTQRLGGELSLQLRPLPLLSVEAEIAYAEGHYVETGEPIPYAPRLLGSLALNLDPKAIGAWTIEGGLRGRMIGPRPLPQGFQSHASLVLDATATIRHSRWFVEVEGDNLTGSHWRDGEFYYPSWFNRNKSRSALPVLHITAGSPTAVRISLGVVL